MAGEERGDQQSLRDSARSNRSDLTGATLGKYRLVEKLGQGGMAQVYKAYQPDLERYVAVKVLHPHLTGDEEFAARFRREARVIAALEHPHCVHIYDFDTDDGLAFLVMEYLVGTSLKARLRALDARAELMDLKEVGHVIGAIADALHHAHSHDVIHRDVKPANVLITADERPVLTDFGIARILDATLITGSSGAMGTPAYMSPEQGKGEPGDARSDIYALGVILYQLCTGHLPFDADTPYAIILKHLTAPLPPPRSLRPNLPESLERVILKALAKDPNDRYQQAVEMARAVRAAIESGGLPMAPRKSVVAGLRARLADLPRSTVLWRSVALIALTLLACVALIIVGAPGRIFRFPAQLSDTPASEVGVNTLVLQGPDTFVDTWLDPDKPNEAGQAVERAQLRGSSQADRILIAVVITRLPPEAEVQSAILTVRVEAQPRISAPCRLVAYRMATLWRPTSATFNSPWSTPGLLAGVDYESTPFDRITLPDSGSVALNMTPAIAGWLKRGRLGGGLVLMLSDDSPSQCQYWVYTTEQVEPTDRPTLRITYKVAP